MGRLGPKCSATLMRAVSLSVFALFLFGCGKVVSVESNKSRADIQKTDPLVAKPQPLSAKRAKTRVQAEVQGLVWRTTDTSVTLLNGGRIVWRFNHDPGAGKPYFHPLATVDGEVLTELRPSDHVHHRALWFAWKFIDGLNYWEEIGRTGRSPGRTEVTTVKTDTHPDGSARITLELAYRPHGKKPVLREHRVLEITAPNADSAYSITWTATFTPLQDLVLDRIPLPGQPGGKAHGGYAGLSIRAARRFHTSWKFIDSEGRTGGSHGKRASWLHYQGPTTPGRRAGLTILDHPDNPRYPAKWFTVTGMPYFGPAVIFDGPMTLKKGAILTLRYRIVVHGAEASPQQIHAAYAKFLQETMKPGVHATPGRLAKTDAPPPGFGMPDRVIELGVRRGQMRFQLEQVVVKPGERVILRLTNQDDMLHNVVLCKRGTNAELEIARAAWALGAAAMDRHFVPEHDAILAHSGLVQPGQSGAVYFIAPQQEGRHPYLCTLPGHVYTMKGVLYVSADGKIPSAAMTVRTAPPPSRDPYELVVGARPLVQRIHVDGATPRTIAVGLPGGFHYAFDPEALRIPFIWTGRFLNVKGERTGRGKGPNLPLGTRVMLGGPARPVRVGRPDQEPRSAQFGGYLRQGNEPPIFRFTVDGVRFTQQVVGDAVRGRMEWRFTSVNANAPVHVIIGREGVRRVESTAGVWKDGRVTVPAAQASKFTIFLDLHKPAAPRTRRNLALGAKASSPDGLERDGAAGGDPAGIDGDSSTYWDEVNDRRLYRYRVDLPRPVRFSVITIEGYEHHNYAPRDFHILVDGRRVHSVKNARYVDNRLTVRFPAVTGARVELAITGYYGRSPAIRELGIYRAARDKPDKPWVVYEGKDGPGRGKHIVFVSGDEEYRSEEACPMLAKILAVRHGFKCTVLFAVDRETGNIDPWERTNIPGLHLLGQADLMVLFTRFRELPDEQMRHLAEFIDSGKGIIGIRPTIAGFRYRSDSRSIYARWGFRSKEWPGGFGKQVLGETWIAHHGAHKRESTRGVVNPAMKTHPMLRGVTDVWGPTDVYAVRSLPDDAKVLLYGRVIAGMKPTDPPVRGKKNDPMMPIAWTRTYVGASGTRSRVFYTSMGASVDFKNEGLRRLLVNACYWGAGLEERIPDRANVDIVGEYHPTFYSLAPRPRPLPIRPSDHRLDPALDPDTPEPIGLILRRGDRIALVGNSLAERMNLYGHFEALLHSRFPRLELVVRNFGWPADEVGVRKRPNNYTKIDDPFLVFGPDVLLCFFGFNESFAGPEGLEKFKADLARYVEGERRRLAKKGKLPRLVLISPVAFEDLGRPFLPDGKTHNENLLLYAAAMGTEARRLGIPFVDLFAPTQTLFAQNRGAKFTVDGAHLNERGDRAIAELLTSAIFGTSDTAVIRSSRFERLREAVNDKSFVHFNDYRMVNGWYVYGRRRKPHDVRTFPEEYAKLRKMAAVRDRHVWGIARDRTVPESPDDAGTGALSPIRTTFGTKRYSEPKRLGYLTPDQALKAFTVAKGYEIGLFASEARFPELANPVQLNFDNRGRLWALVIPTYPQWRPGDARPDDKLLIFEDNNGDGVADTVKTFAGGLHAALSFEFGNGGVYVAQPPKLLFLKDTDGDDRADVREVILDGFGSEDTHVGITALEWTPGGKLLLLEGVAKSTNVETIYGPLRNHTPTVYAFDPRTLRLTVHCPSPHPNPWGYVHDQWGQGFMCDGTTGAQFWTTPLSGAPFGRMGIDSFVRYTGVRLRPAVGCEFVSSRHFPDEVQGNYLFACVINLNGIPQFKVREEGSGYVGERTTDLVVSSDRNFRPVDPQFGPDGALYFGDWHAPLIGHMQYSQRDPNRDHAHGRIYRVTYRERPLLKPAIQAGQPVAALLRQLRAYEDRTRYRARRELRDRDAKEVLSAVERWIGRLDALAPRYEHHLTEALWVQQGHRAVDPALLRRLLGAKDYRARAAATHVLGDESERIMDAFELLRSRAGDAHPRVRLEAVRGLSFIRTVEAVEATLEAAKLPSDDNLDYALQGTLTALRPVWKLALKQGWKIPRQNPRGSQILRYIDAGRKASNKVRKLFKRLLGDDDPKSEARRKNILAMSKVRGVASEGRVVFKRLCGACHKVGGEGIEFGPDLTGVATRLSRAELIESVISPNAKVDPKFQTVNIMTVGGRHLTGFIVAETPEKITLRIAGGALAEIGKADIKKRVALINSGMPEGLAATLSPLEFFDLVEFLAAQK